MKFQAIVMAAGRGSRIMEVTSSIPKCLLPIGNAPVIKSCLKMLKDFEIHDIIVLVSEHDKVKVQEAIETKCDVKVEVISIPRNEDWGTADSLRYIKDKIHSDTIVVSCDMVTNVNLQKMVNMHHKNNSSLTILLTPWSKTLKDAIVPGHKGTYKHEKDIVGFDSSGKLIFFNSEADFENGVPMKISTLNQHPVVQVHSNLMDAHLYIMKKCLLDFIAANDNISTLKGEFLPTIIKKQFSKKLDPNLNLVSKVPVGLVGKELKQLALDLTSLNLANDGNSMEKLKCFAYINKDSFCMRANTLVAYSKLNQMIAKNFKEVMGNETKAHQYPRSQVDNDSIIGEECELLDKSSVKQTVLGNGCILNEKVKVTGSIIMDGVTVQAGSNIQGCIICSNVQIGKQCELKNCVIGSHQKIADMSKLSNDVLQGALLMEI